MLEAIEYICSLYYNTTLHRQMKTNLLKNLLALLILMIPMILLAQPGPPAGGGPPCGPPFGPVCPIDGGVSLLIAAGVALGGKKAYALSRKKA